MATESFRWQNFVDTYDAKRQAREWCESVTFWGFRDAWTGKEYETKTDNGSRRFADLTAERLYMYNKRRPVRMVVHLRVVD
jgi:hypothetical protein